MVPALEVSESLRQSRFVLNMTKEQVARLGQGDKQHFTQRRSLVRPFQVGIYMHGHFHTQFGRWFRTNKPYEIEYGYGFEPYVMVRKPFPEFDESFIGYGQNKVGAPLPKPPPHRLQTRDTARVPRGRGRSPSPTNSPPLGIASSCCPAPSFCTCTRTTQSAT